MSAPTPSSLSNFAYFLILLILIVSAFTYWLCYIPDYLSKKHYHKDLKEEYFDFTSFDCTSFVAMGPPADDVRFDAKWMNRQVINFVTINNNNPQVMLWHGMVREF